MAYTTYCIDEAVKGGYDMAEFAKNLLNRCIDALL